MVVSCGFRVDRLIDHAFVEHLRLEKAKLILRFHHILHTIGEVLGWNLAILFLGRLLLEPAFLSSHHIFDLCNMLLVLVQWSLTHDFLVDTTIDICKELRKGTLISLLSNLIKLGSCLLGQFWWRSKLLVCLKPGRLM